MGGGGRWLVLLLSRGVLLGMVLMLLSNSDSSSVKWGKRYLSDKVVLGD
jgi:hypothetical protein